jgi:hypothetical protein
LILLHSGFSADRAAILVVDLVARFSAPPTAGFPAGDPTT